jgi:hypothetical protein
MTITVQAASEYGIGTGVNGSGKRPLIRGFYVCRNGRPVRAFAQGEAQKWTPALEAKLKAEAEAWAETMRNW